jgi:hypothetical protein
MGDTLKFVLTSAATGWTSITGGGNERQLRYSAAGTDQDAQIWLSGGYGPTGLPNTSHGERANENAVYDFNSTHQFWPLRDPTQSASVVGGVLPTGSTQCSPWKVNTGRCVATAAEGDPIAKIRFRPKMSTLDHTNGKRWGWVSVFNAVDPTPNNIVGMEIPATYAWEVRQNLPCVNGPGGGFISGCLPCDRPGGAPGRCDVVLEDLGLMERARVNQGAPLPAAAAALPCPLPTLALRLGEAVIPYNIMTAIATKGGARDTHDANFYTCEYRSNAIQGLDGLRAFVDGFLTGDVAPCCAAAAGRDTAATRDDSGASDKTSANPCWHVPHDADVPFLRGLPDDFAARFLLNYAARVRMTESGRLCQDAQAALLTQVNRAKGSAAIESYPNVNRALDILAEAIRSVDGARRDCTIAEGRMPMRNADGTVVFRADGSPEWVQGPLWGPWGDLKGEAGAISITQTTANRRLECGPGLQMRSRVVTQRPHCGGDPCPPLTQYRFAHQTCSSRFGSPPGRATCNARCEAVRARTYAQCINAFGAGANDHCTGLVRAEMDSCQRACVNSHPDYACSSNLCLTPGRCDPFVTPTRCGPD